MRKNLWIILAGLTLNWCLLAADQAKERGNRKEYNQYLNSARTARAKNDYGEALQWFQKAIDEAEGFPAGDLRYLKAMYETGHLLYTLRRYDNAAKIFRMGADSVRSRQKEKLIEKGFMLCWQGIALHRGEKLEEAESAFKESGALITEYAHLQAQGSILYRRSYGSLLATMKRYDEAEKLLKEALDAAESSVVVPFVNSEGFGHETYYPDPAELSETQRILALVYAKKGQNPKAEEYYKKALKTMEQASGKEHSNLAFVLHDFGLFYVIAGQPAAAEPILLRALAVEQNWPGGASMVVETTEALLAAYALQNKQVEAANSLRMFMDYAAKNSGESDLVRVLMLRLAARQAEPSLPIWVYDAVLVAAGKKFKDGTRLASYYGLASKIADEARAPKAYLRYRTFQVKILESDSKTNPRDLIGPYNGLAKHYLAANELEKAEEFARKQISAFEKSFGKSDSRTAQGYELLAEVLTKAGKADDSAAARQHAADIMTGKVN